VLEWTGTVGFPVLPRLSDRESISVSNNARLDIDSGTYCLRSPARVLSLSFAMNTDLEDTLQDSGGLS
jgi:hypothetical protein